MNCTTANTAAFYLLSILCLLSGMRAKGEMINPPGGPGSVLPRDRIISAERGLRAKGYDVNDIGRLKLAAGDPEGYVRRDALMVLTHKHGREAIPTLAQALNDPWSPVRCTAARMLGVLGDYTGLERMRKDMVECSRPQHEGDSANEKPPEKPVKGPVLRWKEGRPYDALEAAQVLAEFGDTSGCELAAHNALQSTYAAVRSFAVVVLADLSRIDEATLQGKGCDPEAVLLKVAESETDPTVLGMVADCATSKMKLESQVRLLEAIERSPHSAKCSQLQRQAIASSLAHARKQIEQEKAAADRKTD
jgi:hypothetical protein